MLSQTSRSYNYCVSKLLTPILCTLLLLAGCQTPRNSSESQYDRVSREREQLKAGSQAIASMGKNIKIVVNMLTTNVADHFAVDSLWKYVDQNIAIIKRPEAFGHSGLRIGLADKNFHIRLDVTKRQLKSSEDTELFVVLADGATGYINIGKEISVPRFYYLGRWYSAINYGFRQAGRSLKVTAQKLPSGLIDMELTPVFSKFLTTGGDIELTEISTKVTVRPGQMLVLGGSDTASENVATALLSHSKYSATTQTLVTVTPYIQ